MARGICAEMLRCFVLGAAGPPIEGISVRLFFDWLISVGDAVSQVLGRLIFVRVDGEWVCWTLSANESISGAAYRWMLDGHFEGVQKFIDRLALIVTFNVDKNHCKTAYLSDYARAVDYQMAVETRQPSITLDWVEDYLGR